MRTTSTAFILCEGVEHFTIVGIRVGAVAAHGRRASVQWGLDALTALLVSAVTLLLSAPALRVQGFGTIWFGAIAVGLLYLLPRRRWSAYLVVFLVFTVIASSVAGYSLALSITRSTVDLIATAIIAGVLQRRLVLPMRGPSDAWTLILAALAMGVVRMATGALLFVGFPQDRAQFALLPITLGLTAVIGILILAPLVALAFDRTRWPDADANGAMRAGAAIVGLIVIMGLTFFAPSNPIYLGIAFLIIPIVILLAARFSQLSLAAGMAILAYGMSLATTFGLGPLAPADDSVSAVRVAAWNVQMLLVALPVAAWLLTATRAASAAAQRRVEEQLVEQRALASELAATEEKFRLAVMRAAVPMSFGSVGSALTEFNDAMCAFYGLPRAQLMDRHWEDFSDPEDRDEDRRLGAALARGDLDEYRLLKRYLLDDGTVKWGDLSVSATSMTGTSQRWAIAQIVDVTAEVQARQELEKSQQFFRTAVYKANIPMTFGPTGDVHSEINDAFCEFLGYTSDELQVKPWQEFTHPDDIAENQRLEDAIAAGEIDDFTMRKRYIRSDGEMRTAELTVTAVQVPGTDEIFTIAQCIDLTDMERAQERLLHQVNTDPVTDLHSRVWMHEALQRELDGRGDDVGRVALMLIDLSEFLEVNRVMGYEAGSEALRALASRVRAAAPVDCSVARFDGNAFLVMVPEARWEELLEGIAARILDAVAQELTIRGDRIARTASIGIARSNAWSTALTMERDADQALAVAKMKGRSRTHILSAFDPDVQADRLHQEHVLREALDAREFVVHYQPQVNLRTGAVCGYEALVRWQHPDRGLLPPGAFIETMEQSGLVIPLGTFVLEEACRALASDQDLPGPISINVSAVEFAHPGWLERFQATVNDFAVAPERIVIELTETTVLHLTEDARAALAGVRSMGAGIHVDDFGAGYASVGLLQHLPVTALKLDRSFVTPLDQTDASDLGLVRGIAGLAAGLGLETIAEGIETPRQAELLAEAGWAVGQGYLFGRPVPEFARF